MLKNLKNKAWWSASAVRCIKTICQTAVATIGTTAVFSQIEWKTVLSASLLAGFLSLLTSIGGIPEVNNTEE